MQNHSSVKPSCGVLISRKLNICTTYTIFILIRQPIQVTKLLLYYKRLSYKKQINHNGCREILRALSLSHNYFRWVEKCEPLITIFVPSVFHWLLPMAEAYLQVIEEKALREAAKKRIIAKSSCPYVDDARSWFASIQDAEEFKAIQIHYDPTIVYAIAKENGETQLNFVEVTIIDARVGYCLFRIYRRLGVINGQVKSNCCVDSDIAKLHS